MHRIMGHPCRLALLPIAWRSPRSRGQDVEWSTRFRGDMFDMPRGARKGSEGNRPGVEPAGCAWKKRILPVRTGDDLNRENGVRMIHISEFGPTHDDEHPIHCKWRNGLSLFRLRLLVKEHDTRSIHAEALVRRAPSA